MNKKGFTLIELLIAIAILGILVTGGVATYQRTIRVNSYLNTINEVDALFKQAHSLAIASRAQTGARIIGNNSDITRIEQLQEKVDPIGIHIPLNNTQQREQQKILIFQDNNQNNRYDASDEIINETIPFDPNTIKALEGEENINRITVIYTPPRATAQLFVNDEIAPESSRKQIALRVTDHFNRHKRSTIYRFLRSTGIPLSQRES